MVGNLDVRIKQYIIFSLYPAESFVISVSKPPILIKPYDTTVTKLLGQYG